MFFKLLCHKILKGLIDRHIFFTYANGRNVFQNDLFACSNFLTVTTFSALWKSAQTIFPLNSGLVGLKNMYHFSLSIFVFDNGFITNEKCSRTTQLITIRLSKVVLFVQVSLTTTNPDFFYIDHILSSIAIKNERLEVSSILVIP